MAPVLEVTGATIVGAVAPKTTLAALNANGVVTVALAAVTVKLNIDVALV